MSVHFDARACGPHAWRSWLKTTGAVLGRLPMEGWAWFAAVVLLSEVLFQAAPWAALGLVSALTFSMRRPVGLVVSSLLSSQPLSWSALVSIGKSGWSSGQTWLVGIGFGLGCLLGASAPTSLSAPWFVAWALAGWLVLSVRPWGPIGLVGELVSQGCPPLQAFDLQGRAVLRNLPSFLGMAAGWFLALVFLMALGLWGVPGVLVLFAPATLGWLVLMRCVYLDVFGGGLSLASRAVAKAPASVALG